MTEFNDKVVLITGAAGGIGQALCRHFGAKGAHIGALDRSPALRAFVEQLAEEGITAAGEVCDIADAGAVQRAVERLREHLGPIDVLVNNAGFAEAANLEHSTPESWALEVNGNLNGAYHCTTAVLPDMKARRGGAIVTIGSVNGLASLGHPAYSAAKAALVSYTRSLAAEYGRFGIRANIVCPGTVRTPVWESRVERHPEIFEDLVKWYPLGRVAEPLDIARAATFLASEDASAITGAMLPVDCGLMAGNIVMSRELTLEEF